MNCNAWLPTRGRPRANNGHLPHNKGSRHYFEVECRGGPLDGKSVIVNRFPFQAIEIVGEVECGPYDPSRPPSVLETRKVWYR